ncbi:MAG: acetolactate synthase [Candidatus Solibacter sp.]|nr:acetolactate synthase [Candidatus Solibacter sp.]
MITGGMAMHLNDSLGHHPGLRCIFNHHEQASAMAAEAYARITGIPAVVQVTAGPGGINALTGVFGAWTDSAPMLVISGQVKRATCRSSHDVPGLRQLGDQEADLVAMAAPITKYAVQVTKPESIHYHLEKALYLATTGRPGPSWLDIPLDVQGSMVDPERMAGFDPEPVEESWADEPQWAEIVERLRTAERPVLALGAGVRWAGAVELAGRVAAKLGIPIVPAPGAVDMVPNDDPLYCGRFGTMGDRAGNFTVQNADVLLCVGSRLAVRQIGYNWQSFARNAYRIVVDIDPAELSKPTVSPHMAVACDAGRFLAGLERALDAAGGMGGRHSEWVAWCRAKVERYPVVPPRLRAVRAGRINPYHFVESLFARLADDDAVVCANGLARWTAFQAAVIRPGQRLICSLGCGAMGYDLPAAIGVAAARDGKRVICLAGDGSVNLNIQELQTIVHNRMPIKIFVYENGGYGSMRETQQNFFGRRIGEGPENGISFPRMDRIAEAYGLTAMRIEGADFEMGLEWALRADGPVLATVALDEAQWVEPRAASIRRADGSIESAPIDDMTPLLDREEYYANVIAQRGVAAPANR